MSRLFVGSCLGEFDLDKTIIKPGDKMCVDSRRFGQDEKTMESLEEFERRTAKEYEELFKKAEEARKLIDPQGGIYRLSDIGKYYRLDPLPIGRGWDNDDIARINDWSKFLGGYCDENWEGILREHGMGQAHDLSGREITFEGLPKTKKL